MMLSPSSEGDIQGSLLVLLFICLYGSSKIKDAMLLLLNLHKIVMAIFASLFIALPI